jgi:hypothetical protein
MLRIFDILQPDDSSDYFFTPAYFTTFMLSILRSGVFLYNLFIIFVKKYQYHK